MGTLRGIKQSNIRITRLNQGVGTSFLIGMDDADIAAIARVTTDGGENTKQFIAKLNAWSRDAADSLRMSVAWSSLTVAQSIKARVTSSKYGEPIRVDFLMDRRGYYIYHGASKSYAGLIGSKWKYKGIERTTNPKSIGRAGTAKSHPYHFITEVLDPMMNELSNIVAEYMLENATIALRII